MALISKFIDCTTEKSKNRVRFGEIMDFSIQLPWRKKNVAISLYSRASLKSITNRKGLKEETKTFVNEWTGRF